MAVGKLLYPTTFYEIEDLVKADVPLEMITFQRRAVIFRKIIKIFKVLKEATALEILQSLESAQIHQLIRAGRLSYADIGTLSTVDLCKLVVLLYQLKPKIYENVWWDIPVKIRFGNFNSLLERRLYAMLPEEISAGEWLRGCAYKHMSSYETQALCHRFEFNLFYRECEKSFFLSLEDMLDWITIVAQVRNYPRGSYVPSAVYCGLVWEGLTPDEAVHLKWEDVDLVKQLVRIRGGWKPISPPLIPWLTEAQESCFVSKKVSDPTRLTITIPQHGVLQEYVVRRIAYHNTDCASHAYTRQYSTNLYHRWKEICHGLPQDNYYCGKRLKVTSIQKNGEFCRKLHRLKMQQTPQVTISVSHSASAQMNLQLQWEQWLAYYCRQVELALLTNFKATKGVPTGIMRYLRQPSEHYFNMETDTPD